MEYQFETTPFKHQLEIFNETKDVHASGLFWEQGCGKTKPCIDTVAYLYLQDSIDALLVVAPNGVHRNWLTDELPTHLPKNVLKKTKTFHWDSDKAGTKKYTKALNEFLDHKGLKVLTFSYNGFMTSKGKAFVWKFLRHNRCFYVLDESHFIKTPGAKRTISILASAKYAPYRRILTGTPIAQGPFDLYSQVKFLNNNFWKERDIGGFAAFKSHFGVWRTAKEVQEQEGYDPGYDLLVDYKNLDELNGYLREIGHRLTKESAGLDLPPKLYQKRYFDMGKEQRRIYTELVEDYISELDDGDFVEASLAIVRLLKLQQITCGYVVSDVEEPAMMIGDKNPRLELLKEITEGLQHPAIIWCRFTKDIDQIMDALGDDACRYDGQTSNDEREKSKLDFQQGKKKFFVGNPAAGSTGLTLTQAKTVIYYSNSFKLVDRLQSEDRAHRIGQDCAVNYIDLVCPGTVDEKIVKSLRGKFDIATQITGDNLKEWL